jgi:hypothetical protein
MASSAWKTMESAPKNGTKVLLWATLKTPAPYDPPGPVVGRWIKAPVEQWRPVPDLLDKGIALIPTHWTDIPAFS